ncbi:MAG: hypothetical protein AB7O37_11385 [Vicinamibacteria bacterium]
MTQVKQGWLVGLIRRYPFVSGIIFALIAAVMVQESEFQGQLLARFDGGVTARARIVRTFNAAGRPILPDYQAEVAWLDLAGAQHSTTIRIRKRDFGRLRPGNEVPIVVARDDPGGGAVLEASLRNANVFYVLGYPVTGIGVVGLLMAGGALGLCGWGLRRRLEW